MDAPALQYEPIKPGRLRRRASRWMVRIALCMLIAVVAWRVGNLALYRGRVLYWQEKAMKYVAPHDQVVLNTSLSGAGGRMPSEWTNLMNLFDPRGNNLTTLFLHARKNSQGQSRLVAVECSTQAPFRIYPAVLVPASAFDDLEYPYDPQPSFDWKELDDEPWTPFRIFAGQIDQSDSQHFTIDFEVNGKRRTLDCWLEDDDRIRFSVRRAIAVTH